MSNQAQATNGADKFPPRVVVRGTAELLYDCITLAELQTRLFIHDGRDELRRLFIPVVALAAGVMVAFSCLPLALLALALVLVETTSIGAPQALGISAAIGLVMAAVLVASGFAYLRAGAAMFARSREEWQRNKQWAQGALRQRCSTVGDERRSRSFD